MATKLGQWSLRALLIATAILPVAIYALVKATPMIASVAITLGMLTWTATVIVWLTEKEERQAIARGIAVAAFVYALAFWYTDQTQEYQRRSLVTTRLLVIAYENCETETQVPRGNGRGTDTVRSPDSFAFGVVGQVYWCILSGIAGGLFARWVYRHRKEAESRPLSSAPVGRHDER